MNQFVNFFKNQSPRQILFILLGLMLLIILISIGGYYLSFLGKSFNNALNANAGATSQSLKFDIEGFKKLNLIKQ